MCERARESCELGSHTSVMAGWKRPEPKELKGTAGEEEGMGALGMVRPALDSDFRDAERVVAALPGRLMSGMLEEG